MNENDSIMIHLALMDPATASVIVAGIAAMATLVNTKLVQRGRKENKNDHVDVTSAVEASTKAVENLTTRFDTHTEHFTKHLEWHVEQLEDSAANGANSSAQRS